MVVAYNISPKQQNVSVYGNDPNPGEAEKYKFGNKKLVNNEDAGHQHYPIIIAGPDGQTLIQPGDNPDITAERLKATFPVDAMAAFFYGDSDVVRRRHEILAFVESRPEFVERIPLEFVSRAERYEELARRAVAMTELAGHVIDGSDFFGEGLYYQMLIIGRDSHALHLHFVMFLPTIQRQADDEQLDRWLGPSVGREIIGTYAQTELGHGTNLSRLETTATYDPASQQFVLNSPTLTSTKWWPGSLGKSSNHAIVMAQLWTMGKCHGIHPFIVQLRDPDTHIPFPTIQVGDIGPKFGYNGGDNGFLIFDQHRIPRQNMLMRYAQVTPAGEYIPPSRRHGKLGYSSMVFVRTGMIRDQTMHLAAAAVIAARYSCVRRQGEIPLTSDTSATETLGNKNIMNSSNSSSGRTLKDDSERTALSGNAGGAGAVGDEEVKIIDYQMQQLRVLPHLATTVAFMVAAKHIKDLYIEVNEQLNQGNANLLASLHTLSAGLKAVVSWEVAKGIEQCRLACGGHGYSHASALPAIYAFAVSGCTYEGENIVMLLQVARHLIKTVRHIVASMPISHQASYAGRMALKPTEFGISQSSERDMALSVCEMERYLVYTVSGGLLPYCNHLQQQQQKDDQSRRQPLLDGQDDGEQLIACFEQVAREQIYSTFKQLAAKETQMPAGQAWNELGVELCRCARFHVKAFLVKCFFNKIQSFRLHHDVRPIALDLARLFALNQLNSSDPVALARVLPVEMLAQARAALYTVLARLRPNTVALADSLDLPDRELRSALGRRDGRVYEALFDWARRSPLNDSDVTSAFHKHLGPMMDEARRDSAKL